MQAPQKQLRPNIKRLNSVTKESSKNNLVKEKLKSVVHEGKEQIEADKAKDENTHEVLQTFTRILMCLCTVVHVAC